MGIGGKKEEDDAEKTENERYFQFLMKTMQYLSGKKIIDEIEEDLEEYYNVYVYQVLPYPPNTKDVRDFFIQRT